MSKPMALRAQHFGATFMLGAIVLGVMAFHANASRSVLAAQTPYLRAALVPASAQMTVGAIAAFSVDSIYTDQNGQVSHVSPATINWKPVGATVASYSGVSVVLKAAAASSGNLSVDITYSGLSAHADAPLKIVAAAPPAPKPTPAPTVGPAPSPTPPNATPGPLSDADTARLGTMVTIFRPATPTNSTPLVSLPTLGCLEKNLGARFADISSGKTAPTAADHNAAAGCFTGTDPLPAILAPISPDQIVQLPIVDSVTIAEITKQSVTHLGGQTRNAFHLSGTGTPNASIYLYVFSDPLVVQTKVSASGAWDYLLETSLPAGNHQAYAIIEKDAGNFVRTAAAAFAIPAQRTPKAAVPDAPSPWWGAPIKWQNLATLRIAYATGSGVMALMAIIIFVRLRRGRRARRPGSLPQAPTLVMPATTPVATIMPAQSEAAAAATVEAIVNAPVHLNGAPGGSVDPTYPHDPQS
ncbi:MAG: hypothetical protein NVS3B29_02020 [Candidatus Saccharimonadales bacterium]